MEQGLRANGGRPLQLMNTSSVKDVLSNMKGKNYEY
jgi:hypothetical protein